MTQGLEAEEHSPPTESTQDTNPVKTDPVSPTPPPGASTSVAAGGVPPDPVAVPPPWAEALLQRFDALVVDVNTIKRQQGASSG